MTTSQSNCNWDNKFFFIKHLVKKLQDLYLIYLSIMHIVYLPGVSEKSVFWLFSQLKFII